ncbi:hypothetical protein ACFL6U_28855 [Planctomycetota bacterium]
MIQRQPFDFGRLVDGLTIEIRINENHRQALRIQMIDRFEARQGQRRSCPTFKTVRAIMVGFGLVSIALVVQHRTTSHPTPAVDTSAIMIQVEAAAAARDLDTVTGYLTIQNVPVQIAVIRHLAVLGDVTTIETLKKLLQQSNHPDVRAAIQQTLQAIGQRLQGDSPIDGNEPGHVLRFKVTDPDGRPLRGVRVFAEPWWSRCSERVGTTNAKGAVTLTDLHCDDILYTVTKKGYDCVCHPYTQPSAGRLHVVLWPSLDISQTSHA